MRTSIVSSLAKARAVHKEAQRVAWSGARMALRSPLSAFRSLLQDPSFDSIDSQRRLGDILGELLMEGLDELGPVYGKALQTLSTRLDSDWRQWAETFGLERVYSDWPAMDFKTVQRQLDSELPTWREHVRVDVIPLGVASMAQVHRVEHLVTGQAWAMKILKPHAVERLAQTTEAIDALIDVGRKVSFSTSQQRLLRGLEELVAALREELSLDKERLSLEAAAARLAKKTNFVKIPKVWPEMCTRRVLTMELFSGTSLADVVAGRSSLTTKQKRSLARKMLGELLVQVFELGLFHADPHAGNMILLDDGSVGLFDWGLVGELTERDRRHVSALIKGVLAKDTEKVVQVLYEMALDAGKQPDKERIRSELDDVVDEVKKRAKPQDVSEPHVVSKSQDARKLQTDAGAKMKAKQARAATGKGAEAKTSLPTLFAPCLEAMEKLDIPIPAGMLLMIKSLLTIEGLAKGVDPDVSMARVAAPVLLRVAKPNWSEWYAVAKSLPSMVRLAKSS